MLECNDSRNGASWILEKPELRFAQAGDVRLAAWDWSGEGPPLLFAHATGFHGRLWDQIARAFPGRHRIALDFRGHGRSDKPAPSANWRWFGDDIAAVADAFRLRGAIGVGHSMGGHALVSSFALCPEAFGALLLIDPVIYAPEIYGAGTADVSFISRRRAAWSGPREMFQSFRHRAPFRTWKAEVLRDYCEYALLPEPLPYGRGSQGEAFALACEPAFEASIYRNSNSPDSNLHAEIPKIPIPVTVLRADAKRAPGVFDLSASPTWPDLAARFPGGRDVPLAGRNHFIPMETPEVVGEEIGRV